MRVKAVIAYDGTLYHGFQRQTSTENTITTTIEKALKRLNISSEITGSGRTDAGVHAVGQVIHFDLPPFWSNLGRLQTALNRHLDTIEFKHICPVSDNFHARFSAKKRVYRYLFKEEKPSLFEKRYIAHYARFDATRLKQALALFEGEHDFVHFHKTGSEIHTTLRTIYRTDYRVYGKYHALYFTANGFLRSQVRMMVEATLLSAQGVLSISQLQAQLEGKQKYTTKLAPSEGLYLSRILY